LNAHASGTPGASRLRYWAQLVFPTPKKTCLAPRPQKKQPHTHTHKNGNNNKQRPIWELGGGERPHAPEISWPPKTAPAHCGAAGMRAARGGRDMRPASSSIEAGGILTHRFFIKFAGPPREPIQARPRCNWPGHGPNCTAGENGFPPAGCPTGRAVASAQNGRCLGCVLISRDLGVCLDITATKRRVATYSGSIDSCSRRELLAPCSAAQMAYAPANYWPSKSCHAPSN
jgi:hypothetical protein